MRRWRCRRSSALVRVVRSLRKGRIVADGGRVSEGFSSLRRWPGALVCSLCGPRSARAVACCASAAERLHSASAVAARHQSTRPTRESAGIIRAKRQCFQKSLKNLQVFASVLSITCCRFVYEPHETAPQQTIWGGWGAIWGETPDCTPNKRCSMGWLGLKPLTTLFGQSLLRKQSSDLFRLTPFPSRGFWPRKIGLFGRS